MRRPRVRMTVQSTMIAVALMASVLWVDERSGRREQCRELAAWHARGADEYRRNARGSPVMLQLAAWHDRMRARFEWAAVLPCMPIPASRAYPPWRPRAVTPPAPMPGPWPWQPPGAAPQTGAPRVTPATPGVWDVSTGKPLDLRVPRVPPAP